MPAFPNEVVGGGPLPPPGAPAVIGARVIYIGAAERIGDTGASGGSGDPNPLAKPLKYVVTSASVRQLRATTPNTQRVRLRVEVRNESSFPLQEVRVAIVATVDKQLHTAIYSLLLDKALKRGHTAAVAGTIETQGSEPPALWALVPPVP